MRFETVNRTARTCIFIIDIIEKYEEKRIKRKKTIERYINAMEEYFALKKKMDKLKKSAECYEKNAIYHIRC